MSGSEFLNVSLPKGRLGETVLNMFCRAGLGADAARGDRRLIFENEDAGIRFFWVKPSDVTVYVERGAADIGVAGSDIIDEYSPDVYELLDLGMGKCRMCVVAPEGGTVNKNLRGRLTVATKFPETAVRYYRGLGRDIDIVKLNGSVEIAPLAGLSDVIVDIVETGTTLRENGLVVTETISAISARLIANKSSMKFKRERILAVTELLRGYCGD
ncbi:MAG: ATP phosphoribosyltransferase [Clostridia bacterium]|nr:ATP phosphoribosyltransferase [Clostridia bacterium]